MPCSRKAICIAVSQIALGSIELAALFTVAFYPDWKWRGTFPTKSEVWRYSISGALLVFIALHICVLLTYYARFIMRRTRRQARRHEPVLPEAIPLRQFPRWDEDQHRDRNAGPAPWEERTPRITRMDAVNGQSVRMAEG